MQLIRLSILLAGVRALLASVPIIVLLLTALWKLELGLLISLLFLASMLALSGSLVAFVGDINLWRGALKLELASPKPPQPEGRKTPTAVKGFPAPNKSKESARFLLTGVAGIT